MKDNSKRENVKDFSGKYTGVLGIIAGITALFLLFTIIVFSIVSVENVRSSSMETAVTIGENKLMGDMKNFEDKIVSEYGQLSLKNGKLVGQQGISPEYHYEIVDKFSSDMGIVATVFVREDNDYRRITTSIVNDKGERAINTFLKTNSAAYPSIQSGNEYVGNAIILGRDYLTHYKPIIESNNGDVIGIYFIGIEMVKIQEIISKNTSTHVTQIIIIAIVIILLLFFANVLIFNTVFVKPIQTVTAIIGKLSVGDIDQQIDESKKRNEIGTMQNELRRLIAGLKHTTDFAQNIGKGNLNAEYQPLSGDDVLGNSLLEMRKSLQEAEKTQTIRIKEEEQRNWGTAGLAKFAEILRRDNNDLEALSYNVISNLIKYLGINQGGIFVMNEAEHEEDRVLEMKACYAFDRKKFVNRKIHPGEGLVGTCYLEGESIYMTEVPNEYITITSGLGDANPRALLISPLKVNDQIYGVIELASFHPFEPYQLDFVQKVSESIAATISTVNVNIRTNRLLGQTKLQAEEMANQEEELRQNMEEMQATQEEMRRRESNLRETVIKMQETQAVAAEKEHEMQQFHNAIFATCNVIEFSPELIITDLNQNMADLFGQNRSAFIGKHMSSLLSEETFHTVRTNVMNGRIHEDVQKMDAGNGKTKTIIQKFVPINDNDGALLRVLLIAFHDESDEFKEKTHWFESLLDGITNPISVTDMNGNLIFLNKTSLDMLGTTREEVIGIPCSDIWKIENCHTDKCGYKLLKIGVCKSDFRVGDQMFVSIASYIRDMKGNPVGHIEVINNVTETANHEFEMKQMQDMIFNSFNMCEFSPQGNLTDINQNAMNIFKGQTKTDFIGKPLADFFGEAETQKIMAEISNGKRYENNFPIPSESGKTTLMHNKFFPMFNREKQLQRFLMLAYPENN